MKQYLDLMRHVRENGIYKDDRTGTGTLSVFGHQMRIDLNDLTEEHRDLFSELVRTVEELRQSLANLEEEDRLLSEENTGVGDRIDKALPIWKQTWLTFVASAGGVWVGTAAGSTGSIAAAYTAGFFAGVLHDTFSPGVSCIT